MESKNYYRFDIRKAIEILLPSPLRKLRNISFLSVLAMPITRLYESFSNFKDYAFYEANITCQVSLLQKVLNDKIDNEKRRIRVIDKFFLKISEDVFLYSDLDGQPSENDVFLYSDVDGQSIENDAFLLSNFDVTIGSEFDFIILAPFDESKPDVFLYSDVDGKPSENDAFLYSDVDGQPSENDAFLYSDADNFNGRIEAIVRKYVPVSISFNVVYTSSL